MPRILVADDHPTVRRYVREVLESEEGWVVCGEAATGREALTMTAAERPDVVVLDLSMPDMNGLEATREIHKRFPEIELLILTMHDAHEFRREAIIAGARDCVGKSELHNLVDVVRKILQQSTHSVKPSSSRVQEEPQRGRGDTTEHSAAMLTEREREIVRMLAQAKSDKEIAVALSLT